MKKKGLIISTIVMVVVLIASLTTATYAWFTASSVTSLQDFNVSVATDNNVNIGFKKDPSAFASGTVASSLFVTGTTVYTRNPSDGLIGGGWTGSSGLSATLKHDISWGAQTKAVAAEHSASAISTPSTSAAAYASIGTVLAANVAGTEGYANYSINAANDGAEALTNVAKAQANYKDKNGSTPAAKNGDYVYMFLGASPNKVLDANALIIAVDWSDQTGSDLGILSAIHVAYRLSKNGAAVSAWTDVDLFGADNPETTETVEGYHFNTGADGVTTNITGTKAAAYLATYGGTDVPTRTYCMSTGELSHAKGEIDQIELIIYIDGTDSDCNNSALSNIAGSIKIFFDTTVHVEG